MAAGFAARYDKNVHAGFHLLDGVLPGAHQGGHSNPRLLAALQHVGRRRAQGVGDQTDGVREGDIEQRVGAAVAHVVTEPCARSQAVVGEVRGVDAVAGHEAVNKCLVRLGHLSHLAGLVHVLAF